MKFSTTKNLKELMETAAAELESRLAVLGAKLKVQAELRGEDVAVKSFAAADQVEPGGLCFAIAPNYLELARKRGAAAVVVSPALDNAQLKMPAIITPEPRLLFSIMLDLAAGGADAPVAAGRVTFKDEASVSLGEGVILGEGVYVGARAKIGKNVRVAPMAYIDDDVEIGDDCVIHPKAILRRDVRIGRRCQIHAGAVIGEDGFGYSQLADISAGRLWHVKNPHLGGVVIGDDVEIGALAAVDRGLVSDTVIEDGSKIDNLVQIGHNCHIHRDCIIVAQTGIGGHSVLGERVFLLGQAGLGPGVTIGEDAVISAQSGVGSGAIPAGRELWSGSPARPNSEAYQVRALSSSQLPKLRKFFQLLKKSRSFDELKEAFFTKDE